MSLYAVVGWWCLLSALAVTCWCVTCWLGEQRNGAGDE